MPSTTDNVDRKIWETMAALDIDEYPSWPEPKRSQALIKLIEFLPIAAFGSLEMWHKINDLIIDAYKIEFELEGEQASIETAKALHNAMRRAP